MKELNNHYFPAMSLSGPAPLNVTFTDTTTGSPTSWNWDFGDGNTSTEQNPSYIYANAGTFNVSLTAANAGRSNATVKAGYINVTGEGPVADFNGTPLSGEAPLTVSFTDLSTGEPSEWNWSFGDDSFSEDPTPSHTYTEPGIYVVILNAINSGGSDIEEKLAFIIVTPPTTNQATNIEGRSDWAPLYSDVSEYAKNKQISMGYDSLSYLRPEKANVLSRLPTDSIFHFNGHGRPGEFQVDDQSDIWVTGSELDSMTFPKMKFALFQCCNCGEDSSVHGNLVAKVTGHGNGQTCAFGFSEELLRIGGATNYAQGFWDAAAQGLSPSDCHSAAIQRIVEQHACEGTPDSHCNYNSLVSSGICTQSLTIPTSAVKSAEYQGTSNSATANLKISQGQVIAAKEKIYDFSGVRDKSLKYERTEKADSGDMNEFSSDKGRFTIDTSTDRIIFASFNKTDKSNNPISIEKAQELAESYAQTKYPELWVNNSRHSVKNIERRLLDHGSLGKVYSFTWRDVHYSKQNESSTLYEITGLGNAHVTISVSGDVIMYSESYAPDEPFVDRNPLITEEKAWEIARTFYEKQGLNDISPKEKTSHELLLWDDSWNEIGWPKNGQQYLAWKFSVRHKEADRLTGGDIIIDAHDGHIIDHGIII